MRNGWKVKGISTHCACGKTNSVDHSLICKLGGYTSMRHNSVRDSEAQIMREVCRDVQTKPTLLPINENWLWKKSQHCWQCKIGYLCKRTVEYSCEETFFDIRITHPTSQSYSGKSLAEVYQQHEKEKDKYNQTVIDIEKSSFNPPCFHNKWRDGTRMQQSQQKTGRKNSWKTQGAICICHNIHKD